jgi:hypothetical protein
MSVLKGVTLEHLTYSRQFYGWSQSALFEVLVTYGGDLVEVTTDSFQIIDQGGAIKLSLYAVKHKVRREYEIYITPGKYALIWDKHAPTSTGLMLSYNEHLEMFTVSDARKVSGYLSPMGLTTPEVHELIAFVLVHGGLKERILIPS